MVDHIASRPQMWDMLDVLDEHFHKESKCYPTLAGGVTVTGAAGAWTLGSFAEIVPVNTITEDFDIHFVNIENANVEDTYELRLYATTTEIACVRFTTTQVAGRLIPAQTNVQTPIISANSQIQAKIASSSGGSDTATISLQYHVY